MSEKKSYNWTAEQVIDACERMQTIERVRATDRAMINAQFNGSRPYSLEEQEKHQIHVNVNWLEGSKLLTTATNQLNNALIFKDRFFTATSKGGKIEKRQEYGDIFTRNIHEPLKRGTSGKRHMFTLKSRNASVSLHGIGAVVWLNSFRWRGRYVALEDMLIPTDTLCDFSNLMYFAVNLYLTAGEFYDMTHGDKTDSGWKKKAVEKILDDVLKPDQMTNNNDSTMFRDQPEKRVEWIKQNRCMLDSDAVTTVKLRMFFYKEPRSKKWHRCVVLREPTPSQTASAELNEFLYDGTDKPFADNVDQICHVQFGDNSLVAPLKYQSVRGLGVLLYSAVECNNRLRCETVQHVLMNLKTWFRASNPIDRDRPKMFDLSQYSVLDEGLSLVPEAERHQIDPRLVEYAQSQMRQIMSESSASFVQNINDGTSKEMTATETEARVQSVNVQVSAMLQSMYAQEEFYYEETKRRFCDPNSEDEEVKDFQKKCKEDGIPDDLMTAGNWTVNVERVLGAGDQMLASQEANALLSQKAWMDSNSQRIVERKWITTITRNPDMGRLLVPESPDRNTSGVKEAENVFSTLMQGIPLDPREGVSRTDYTEAMLGMLKEKIDQITKADNMGTPEQIVGLKTVIQHIAANIQMLEPDLQKREFVKFASDELGNLANLVKGFEQRLMEKMQEQQNAVDPETAAKAQVTVQMAQQKMQLGQMNAQQKLMQKQASFEQKMRQDIERHAFEMERAMAEAQVKVLGDQATTTATIGNEAAKTASQIDNEAAKTEASIEAEKKRAAAAPKPSEKETK